MIFMEIFITLCPYMGGSTVIFYCNIMYTIGVCLLLIQIEVPSSQGLFSLRKKNKHKSELNLNNITDVYAI